MVGVQELMQRENE